MEKPRPTTAHLLVLAATLAGFLLLAGMRAGDPFDGFLAFNEGWYAMIAQNYSHHSLLEPTVWEGRTDLNVPPLYSWALRGAALAFGGGEATFRGVSIFFALAALIGVFMIGWRLYGPRTGALAAALLAFCPLFLVPGRNVQTDSTFLAFMLLGIYFWLRMRERESAGAAGLTGLLFGAALLAKQFAGLAAPVIVAHELFADRGKRLVRASAVGAALIAAALPFSFYQYHLRTHPQLLWKSQRYEALTRAAVPALGTFVHSMTETFFGASPLLALFFVAAVAAALISRKKEHALALAGAAAFLAFSVFVPKHTYYAMGALPFLALLGGSWLDGMRSRRVAVVIAAALALSGVFFSLLALGNLKYGYHRFSDICEHVRESSRGTAGRPAIVADFPIFASYEPAIRYYCPGVDVINKAPLSQRPDGVVDLGRGAGKVFLLDYSGPWSDNLRSPYVTVYDKTLYGVSLLGFTFGVEPAAGRTFAPGKIFVGRAGPGAPIAGMSPFVASPTLALVEAPPDRILTLRDGRLTLERRGVDEKTSAH